MINTPPGAFRLSRIITCLAVSVVFLLCASRATADGEESLFPVGTYRLNMRMVSQTRVPVFGNSRSASVSVSLVEVRREGASLIQSHRVCDFRVDDGAKLIRLVFPEKFIASLAQPAYPVQIEKDGDTWRYRADLGLEHVGYKPGNGADPVPTRADDPTVFDWDNDGRPGATLKLSVPLLPDGELYVVQRGQSILHGNILEPGRVEGTIEVLQFEQHVIGAWPSFLKQSPEIKHDPVASRFSLTRIAPGSTCESVRRSDGTAQ